MVEDSVAADRSELEKRIDALVQEANRLRETEAFDRMLELGTEAKRLSESIHYRLGIARSMGVIAFVHYIRSDLHLAVDESMQALQMVAGDPLTEGRIRGILALIHWSLGNFADMSREGELATKLMSQSPERIDEAFVLVSRAGISHSLGDYVSALEQSERALRILDEKDNLIARGRAYAQIGAAHTELGNFDEALDFHRRALECGRKSANRLLISRSLNEIGVTHARKGDDNLAEQNLQEALDIRTSGGYSGPAITSLLDLGRLYVRRGDLEKALQSAATAEKMAFEIGVRPKLADIHLLISEISERQGDLSEALRRLRTYQQLRESILGEQTQLRVQAMRLMTQIETLRAEQAETVNAEKMAAVGSLVGALAHEMNSPLGVIRSSADTLTRAVSKMPASGSSSLMRENAETVIRAADRISLTLGRLKSFAGLDLAEFREADLVTGIEQALEIVTPEFLNRIRFIRDIEPIPLVKCYAAELNQVFLYILRNGCEAIEGEGEIRVVSRAVAPGIRLSFLDTGRGIAPDRLARIFDPGFNRSDKRVRASLSLFTCLNIVQKHNGTLDVRSTLGQGSTFMIALPAGIAVAA